MKMIKYIKRAFKPLGFGLGSLCLLTACNTSFDRMIPEKDYSDTTNVAFGTPKVLYIIVDGARGTSVRDAKTPNISSLLSNSIYSWNGLADADATTNAANYSTMLTGVKAAKHLVKTDDFGTNKFAAYPAIFKRIKASNPEIKSAVYTSSALLKENLTTDATISTQLNNDDAVKSAVVNNLEKDEASVIVAQFSGVDDAGKTSGYDLSFAAYKDAIVKFDGYLGEMLTALKKRPKYAEEKWLVIVSSNKGGMFQLPPAENDNTIFSNTLMNTFTIYNNSSYTTRIVNKPYLGSRYQGNFVKFSGNLRALNPTADNSIYNFGDSSFTVEIKVKKNANANYPNMVGKRERWTGAYTGWNIFLEGNYWMINLKGNTTQGLIQIKGADMSIGVWNSIAVVCVVRSGKRYIRSFTNGVFNNESEITNRGSLDNTYPLIIGKYADNGSMDASLADVKVWKTALPDATIKQFACDTYVDPGHPFYDYLISYWPMTDGTGNVYKDQGLAKIDMTLQDGGVTWQSFTDLICSPPSTNLASLVPSTVDIPAQIYSWLRVPRQESWLLDGRVWLDQ